MVHIFYVGHDRFRNEVRVFLDTIESIEEDGGGSFIVLKSGRNISLIEPPAELEVRFISSEMELAGETAPPGGSE